MVRRVVEDPDTADGLSPRDLPIGCKRPILHTDYYETFNHDHVTLVDLRRGAIEEITPTGIRTAQGEFELDMIVYATGFDAMTGALDRIDIRGRGGQRLRDVWADGARTLLGIQIAGFPNLFTVTGPGARRCSPTWSCARSSTSSGSATASLYLREHGYRTIEATREAQDAWVETGQRGCDGHDVHRAHVQLVVPRRQHPGKAAGVPPVGRRAPGVHRALRRRGRGGLRRVRALVTGGGPASAPKITYDLRAAQGFAPPVKTLRGQWAIPEPTAVAMLQTQRFLFAPARDVPGFSEALWADSIPKLLQARLIDSFENYDIAHAPLRATDVGQTDFQLLIDVRRFRIAMDGDPAVEIGLSAKILDKDGKVIASRLFEESQKLDQAEPPAAVAAFGEAFSRLAKSMIGWTVQAP